MTVILTQIKSLLGNIIFLSAITSLFVAQVLKIAFYLLSRKSKKHLDINIVETFLWRTGGMPSSHSAVVCSLTTSAAFKEGLSSDIFVICLVFAMVVLRDALGVRRSAGLQAKALNNLGKQAAEKSGLDFNSVKEIQGHTPLEVIVGSLLGIAIAIIFYLIIRLP